MASILALPTVLGQGGPWWQLPASEQVQLWVWVAVFLAWTTLAGERVLAVRRMPPPLLQDLRWGLVGATVGYGYLWHIASVPHSRSIAAGSLGLALAGIVIPKRVNARALSWAALAPWVLGLAPALRQASSEPAPAEGVRTIPTALHNIALRRFPVPGIGSRQQGGALTAWGDGYLLATAHGQLIVVDSLGPGRSPRLRPLPLSVPLNLEAYLAHPLNGAQREPLRVTDLEVDDSQSPHRLLVVHQYWNASEHCFTMRVSTTPLPTGESTSETSAAWETLFESVPCVPHQPPINALETGGQLTPESPGIWLLSLGNMGYDGLTEPSWSQDPAADYGKVWRLAASGERRLLSWGHRNPQGLVVARDGTIWSSEHGPKGGDELNVLVEGANYGWPVATYGTQYGQTNWPLSPPNGTHRGFAEPRLSFVPSVGPSGMIEVRDGRFPAWNGDLLVGSLIGRALHRIRVDGDQVRYSEAIPIGERVRSLAQGADGGILLWTDERNLLWLEPQPMSPADSVVSSCRGCHGPALGGSAFGPSLQGLGNRPVASDSIYPYSEGIRALGGTWSRQRLDAFLADPEALVPGTTMRLARVAAPRLRAEVLDAILAETERRPR